MQGTGGFGDHFAVHIPGGERQTDAAEFFQEAAVTAIVARQFVDFQVGKEVVDLRGIIAEVEGDDVKRRVFTLRELVEQRQFGAAGRAPQRPDVKQRYFLLAVVFDQFVKRGSGGGRQEAFRRDAFRLGRLRRVHGQDNRWPC